VLFFRLIAKPFFSVTGKRDRKNMEEKEIESRGVSEVISILFSRLIYGK